uniref:BZIP domain-containing protein n=1 Tax=Anopheles farauti TaxID=69004 RepID=A0A182QCB1_9DIPT
MEGDINNFLFGQDDWPEEEFMNSLLKIDDTMLFSEPPINVVGGSDELDDIMRQLNYSYSTETYLGEQQITASPLSSHSSSDQEFHGFANTTDGSTSSSASLDGYFDDGYDLRMQDSPDIKPGLMNVDFGMLNVLDPNSPAEQEAISSVISSAASDSGLSSDHLDLDPNTEYEALSPGMSSPGPSISERGGQSSPQPRYVKTIPQQPMSAGSQTRVSSSISVAPQTIVQQPVANCGQRTAQPPVVAATTASLRSEQKLAANTITTNPQPMKTNGKAPTTTTNVFQTATPGTKALVVATGPKKIASANGITMSVVAGTAAPQQQQQQQQQFVNNGKEMKIIRLATMKNGQKVAVANGLTTAGVTPNKKVTLQLKNSATTMKTTSGSVIPKNVVLTSAASATSAGTATGTMSGVRKIIRMQQQTHQNGRQILVPVTIQDLRTIKIVNSNNLKSKSANIKLAAANMLQQSKQGLIQKNVVLSKDQLLVDDCGSLSDAAPSSSDSESYVFEDIMQQSNSVIAEVERQQKHSIISDSDVEPDGDDGDDDDVDMDDIGKGRNQNGTYQKLMLTAEEKRLLAKEGISLPSSYPLTKHEERELKRIRRKIRNKISAQDSRKRKKEYVDGLEERVKQCTEENQNLVKRIKILQSQNHDLVSQMKRIQSLLTKGTSKTTQPATCLMVLLISMALVAVPNLKLGNTATQQNIQDSIEMSDLMQDPANDKLQVVQQSRRALLFDTKEQTVAAAAAPHTIEEELNFDEIMSSFNANSLIANEHDYFSEADGRSEVPSAKRAKLMATTTTLIDYDVDDEVWNGGSKMRIKQEAGSMSPDSSSSGNNLLFEQKVREFQETLQKSVHRAEHDAFNSEVIVDRDLFGKKLDSPLYELNLHASTFGKALEATNGIDLLGVRSEPTVVVSADSTGAGDAANDARKLNASQQIQQQNNNKRKLLL